MEPLINDITIVTLIVGWIFGIVIGIMVGLAIRTKKTVECLTDSEEQVDEYILALDEANHRIEKLEQRLSRGYEDND